MRPPSGVVQQLLRLSYSTGTLACHLGQSFRIEADMGKLLQGNFHEKALFVKPTWRLPWPSATALSALRVLLPSAVNTLYVVAGDASDRSDPSIRRPIDALRVTRRSIRDVAA